MFRVSGLERLGLGLRVFGAAGWGLGPQEAKSSRQGCPLIMACSTRIHS